MFAPTVQTETLTPEQVDATATRFAERFTKGSLDDRKSNYKELVNEYYDLVTTFYEWGWGESFHFCRMFHGETRQQGISRHAHTLAAAIGLRKGMTVVDVGCGVGGPARQIARFSGATIVGVNNNAYQISRGKLHDEKAGLSELISYEKCDFLHMPFADGSLDAAYSIEATCHAPNKDEIYGEIFRVLKPGAVYGCYEWVMTSKYCPTDAEHVKIKEDIMLGDGLPDIDTMEDTLKAMRAVGFEVIESCDLAHDEASKRENPVPWYSPLAPGWNPANLKTTTAGRMMTLSLCKLAEALRLAPPGTANTQRILMQAADGLVKGGEKEIFSPMMFMLVRKPKA